MTLLPGEQVELVKHMRSALAEDATWRVILCGCELCEKGRHVAVNEPSHAEGYTNAPIAERPRWRHITRTSLQAVKVPEKIEDMPETQREIP